MGKYRLINSEAFIDPRMNAFGEPRGVCAAGSGAADCFINRYVQRGVPNGRYAVTKICRCRGPAGYRSLYEAAAYSDGPPNRPACIDDWETRRYPYPYRPQYPYLPPYRFGRGYPPYNCYEEYRAGCYAPPPVVQFDENPFAPATPFAYNPLIGDYPYRTPCDI